MLLLNNDATFKQTLHLLSDTGPIMAELMPFVRITCPKMLNGLVRNTFLCSITEKELKSLLGSLNQEPTYLTPK